MGTVIVEIETGVEQDRDTIGTYAHLLVTVDGVKQAVIPLSQLGDEPLLAVIESLRVAAGDLEEWYTDRDENETILSETRASARSEMMWERWDN